MQVETRERPETETAIISRMSCSTGIGVFSPLTAFDDLFDTKDGDLLQFLRILVGEEVPRLDIPHSTERPATP